MAEKKWSAQLTHRIGLRIAGRRKELGISARELSERTKELGEEIPQQVITNVENGRREALSVAELTLLGVALETAPIELLFPALLAGAPVEYLPGQSVYHFVARESFSGSATGDDPNNYYPQIRDLLKLEGEVRQIALDMLESPPSPAVATAMRKSLWTMAAATKSLRRSLSVDGVVLTPPGGMLEALQGLPTDEGAALDLMATLMETWSAER